MYYWTNRRLSSAKAVCRVRCFGDAQGHSIVKSQGNVGDFDESI
jgi:hypothetical protein